MYSTKRLVFTIERDCVYCRVRTETGHEIYPDFDVILVINQEVIRLPDSVSIPDHSV
jgi:hypothetical protein